MTPQLAATDNVLITGIPRGGTTLLGALVDGLRDACCLSEPTLFLQLLNSARSSEGYVDEILATIPRLRRDILAGIPIEDRRSPTGSVVTNYFGKRQEAGTPRAQIAHPIATTHEGLSETFLLAIKHNVPFTAVLPELVKRDRVPIIALVRHPVPTISSWRNVELPISLARAPLAEKFWPIFLEARKRASDIISALVLIYDGFCERYLRYEKHLILLRYEDMCRTPSSVSDMFNRQMAKPATVHAHSDDDSAESDEIRRALRKYGKHLFEIYDIGR